jgi:hypothetical protein
VSDSSSLTVVAAWVCRGDDAAAVLVSFVVVEDVGLFVASELDDVWIV